MNARYLRWVAIALAWALLGGCGYNNLQRQDENVKAAWSEVVNQYQRRAELVPNLVKTVAGLAQQQVVSGVTQARATVSAIPASADVLNNPEAFARYQAAQSQLTRALENLLAASDGNPQLQSNESFRDLRVQLQSRQRRIALALARYVATVRQYNSSVGTFPVSLTARMLDFHALPTLAAAAAQISSPAPGAAGARPAGGRSEVASTPAASPAQPEPEPPMPHQAKSVAAE